MAEKLTTDGAFGAPPPGAPRQTTAAGSERATPDQIRAARANEVEQPAFAPKPMSREAQIALIGREAVERLEAQTGVRAPEVGVGIVPGPSSTNVVQPEQIQQQAPVNTSTLKPVDTPLPSKSRYRKVGKARPPVTATDSAAAPESPDASVLPIDDPASPNRLPVAAMREDESITDWQASQPPQPPRYQPAASDSDSPARGVPKPIDDEGKRITGGFGDPIEAQYIPLSGDELAAVVGRQLDEIKARLEDDLRFSMAVTYPRVRARVIVQVEAYAQAGFEIVKLAPEHTKTPLQLARERADEVVFVLVSEREEMTDAGESVTPPNAMRTDAGLAIPGKRQIETPAGRMLVDIPTDLSGRQGANI